MSPSAPTACLRHRLPGRFLASCETCCAADRARRAAAKATTVTALPTPRPARPRLALVA